MSDFAVEFQQLGALFEFLDLALRNGDRLGISRRDLDEIHVDPDPDTNPGAEDFTFTVLLRGLTDAAWDELRRTARLPPSRVRGDRPGGAPRRINEVFERIRLARQPGGPARGQPETAAAVLLFGATDETFRERYTELLDMGCGELRLGMTAPGPENGNLTHVVFIGRVPRTFWPPDRWAAADGRSRAVAFYRLRPDGAGRFYVQWGYEYPAAQVDALYDFGQDQCRVVFACAASPAARDAGAAPQQFLRVREQDLESILLLPEHRPRLEPAAAAPAVELRAPAGGTPPVLDFRVQRHARGTGTPLEELEKQMAWHEQALDLLRREYQTAHGLRHEPVYLAFVFEQDLGQEGEAPPPLDRTFARFLDQPYNQLRHLRYAFYEELPGEARRVGWHVVIGTQPESYAQVWTRLASAVYIQRAAWNEWNLPLFVRHGDDLRPRLDDRELEPLVRELLWDRNRHPYDQPVLVRSLPPDEAERAGQPWQVFCLGDTTGLTDRGCFRFLNTRFAGALLRYRAEVPPELEDRLRETLDEAGEAGGAIEQAIADASARRIDRAEQEWRGIDTRIEGVQSQAAEHDSAITRIQAAVASLPGTWAGFVERVVECNNELLNPQLTALGDYRKAQRSLGAAMQKYQDTLVDVQDQTAKDEKDLTKWKDEAKERGRKAEAGLNELHRLLEDARRYQVEVQQRVSEQKGRANERLHQATEQLEGLREEARSTKGRLEAVKRQLESLAKELLELQRQKKELANAEKQHEADERKFQAERADLEKRQREFSDRKRQLQQARQEQEAKETQLNQEKRKAEEKFSQERQAHDSRLKALREAVADVEKRRQAMQTAVRGVQSLAERARKLAEARENDKNPDVQKRLYGELLQDLRKALNGLGGPPAAP